MARATSNAAPPSAAATSAATSCSSSPRAPAGMMVSNSRPFANGTASATKRGKPACRQDRDNLPPAAARRRMRAWYRPDAGWSPQSADERIAERRKRGDAVPHLRRTGPARRRTATGLASSNRNPSNGPRSSRPPLFWPGAPASPEDGRGRRSPVPRHRHPPARPRDRHRRARQPQTTARRRV